MRYAALDNLQPAPGSDPAGAPASRRVSKEDQKKLEHAARQFEALFLAQMLKVMRTTVEEAGAGEGSFGKGIYTDLFDQQLAETLAARGALGIADIMIRSLADAPGREPDPIPPPGGN